jgi:hypothetical protein
VLTLFIFVSMTVTMYIGLTFVAVVVLLSVITTAGLFPIFFNRADDDLIELFFLKELSVRVKNLLANPAFCEGLD